MKITGTSSFIEVNMENGLIAKIQGEMLMDGFVAYMDTLKYWEYPNNKKLVTENEKNIIKDGIENKNKNSAFKIFLE